MRHPSKRGELARGSNGRPPVTPSGRGNEPAADDDSSAAGEEDPGAALDVPPAAGPESTLAA